MNLLLILVGVLLFTFVLHTFLRHIAPRSWGGTAQAAPGRLAPAPVPTARRSILRRVYHWRGFLVCPPLALAAVVFIHETEAGHVTWPLGVAVVALGVALRVWAQMHIRFRLKEHRHLATTGPYALCRNPLYIANTLICAGCAVASELLWVVPVTVAWCFVLYSLVVRQEEARLLHKYGKPYRDYLSSVPRWVPRTLDVRRLGEARRYLRAALLVEVPCLLTLVPYVVKDMVSGWVEH